MDRWPERDCRVNYLVTMRGTRLGITGVSGDPGGANKRCPLQTKQA